uniref:Uncharacterized protein n=1 Tax=Anguilla anguilla TaxID=7936 RepID=A0A0E9SAM0_ANGAN
MWKPGVWGLQTISFGGFGDICGDWWSQELLFKY